MRRVWIAAMILGCLCICGAGCKGQESGKGDAQKEEAVLEEREESREKKDRKDGGERKEKEEGETAEGEAGEQGGSEAAFGKQGGGESVRENGGEYIFPESSLRLLTEEELRGASPEKLRLGRNEIYARHGRTFTSADLKEYFEARDWYEGRVAPEAFSEDMLSGIEKENVRLIQAREDMGDVLEQAGIYRDIMEQHGLFGWNGLLEYGRIEVAMSGNYREWFPELVDRGAYYEAMDQVISVPVYYDWDYVEKVKPGDKMTLSFGLNPDRAEYTVTGILQEHKNKARVISVLGPDGYGEMQLVFTDVFGNGKYALAVASGVEGDSYVIWDSDDISCACEILYYGSFYLAKDCVIEVAGEERSVEDQWEMDLEGNPFGGAIYGDIVETDEHGLITRIRQQVAG